VRLVAEQGRMKPLAVAPAAYGLRVAVTVSPTAASATLVDNAAASLKAMRANADLLGAGEQVIVQRVNALRFVEGLGPAAYDIAFADPPYRKGLAAEVAELWRVTPFARLIGIEHELRDPMPPGGTLRRYGSTAITFYEAE